MRKLITTLVIIFLVPIFGEVRVNVLQMGSIVMEANADEFCVECEKLKLEIEDLKNTLNILRLQYERYASYVQYLKEQQEGIGEGKVSLGAMIQGEGGYWMYPNAYYSQEIVYYLNRMRETLKFIGPIIEKLTNLEFDYWQLADAGRGPIPPLPAYPSMHQPASKPPGLGRIESASRREERREMDAQIDYTKSVEVLELQRRYLEVVKAMLDSLTRMQKDLGQGGDEALSKRIKEQKKELKLAKKVLKKAKQDVKKTKKKLRKIRLEKGKKKRLKRKNTQDH